MSLDIDQIALHQMIKRDEQTLELVLRESPLEVSPAVQDMMAELHRVYSAKSKAYGVFTPQSELADAVRGCRRGNEDFLGFSRAAPRRGDCAMNWRNTLLPKGGSYCFANIVVVAH